MQKATSLILTIISIASSILYGASTPQRQVLFGETHLHTNLSGDAYASNTTLTGPDEAYRYAKGQPVLGTISRAVVQRRRALDFTAVTDHSEYMGVLQSIANGDDYLKKSEFGRSLIKKWKGNQKTQQSVYYTLGNDVSNNKPNKELWKDELRQPIWNKIINAAEKYNQPGKFTTFIGYEWTSQPNGSNLHRVVLLNTNGSKAKKFLPYSSFDSDKPENLWKWLDKISKQYNIDMLAIPHNPNISNGLMFSEKDSYGKPITKQYAKTRMAWEPVVEITQMKGDSETSPALSPTDEFANYEKYEHIMDFTGGKHTNKDLKASYVRSGLERGLEIEDKIGANPYKMGFIGSSDSHTGLTNTEEFNASGKFGTDTMPENKGIEVIPGATGWDMSSAGVAAVWAEQNTRDSIFKAIKRKETYATTGTFITLRVFGGYDYSSSDAKSKDFAKIGYSKGVPMGGDLTNAPSGKKVKLIIRAIKDPDGANLDRVQVIKGWVDASGKSHEKVYNVAWSKGRGTNPNHIKSVGNTVNLKTARYTNTIGTSELYTTWTDPSFNPKQRAFYYVRVLEIPTPRNSLFNAIALGIDYKKTGHPATIQERAYSSPIWYTPKA